MPDYALLRRIGSGSYGDVWLGRNVLGQLRAVKIVYRSRFLDPRPFERELEGIEKFEPISRSHPSQLHILHVGKNDTLDCFYYVMELADGTPRLGEPQANQATVESYVPHTLRSALQEHGRLPPSDCVRIGLSLATALAHLHKQGLVHRDIKPSNVLFVEGVAKLGDIGLVTEAGDTQSIVGTEGYLPPEGPGTAQADIYSLGKVLYELSTGMDRRRFAELPEDLGKWPDARAVVELNEIVLKACARDPASRYGSAGDMASDLELLRDGGSVKRAQRINRSWSITRRLLMIGSLLAALTAVILFTRGPAQKYAEGGPPSTNQVANAACSKALRSLRVDNYRSFGEVYTNLHLAIRLDPRFAMPYVGLLELLLRETPPQGLEIPPAETVRTVAERLKELAPGSAAAHCGQAVLAFYDWDFPKAEDFAKRTLRIDPEYELGHTVYGFMLAHWGRPVEAREQLKLALDQNPSKAVIFRCIGHSYYAERNFPLAIQWYKDGIGWSPHDVPCYLFMGRAYLAMEDYRSALDVFERMEQVKAKKPGPGDQGIAALRAAFGHGTQSYWQEALRQAPPQAFYGRAGIHARLQEVDSALEALEESYRTRERYGVETELTYLLFDEVWDPLRSHPRFMALLQQVGFNLVNPKLAEELRTAGNPQPPRTASRGTSPAQKNPTSP